MFKDMASPSSLLSDDQFTCTICLDVFTEPVSIPCGHNFCKACISRHWEDKALRQCPLCKSALSKGVKLCVNAGFREVVESYRKLRVLVKPVEVPCDRCPGCKIKATKSCLVCVASYCDAHQAPHRRVAALKRHKLTDPVPNLRSVVCKEHNSVVELFCRKDMVCCCVLCTQHKTHDTVPLEEEYEEMASQLVQKKVEIIDLIQEREKKVQEVNDDMETKRRRCIEAKMSNAQVISALIESVQIGLCRLMRELDEKQRGEERQAQVLVKELEEEIAVLQRRIGKVANVSNTEGPLQFIKSFLRLNSSPFPRLKNWSDVSVSGQHRVEDVRKALTDLEETLTKEMECASGELGASCNKILCEETVAEGRKWFNEPPDLDLLPEGLKLLALREHYGVDMTFDPGSTSELLLFSQNFKAVQTCHICWFQNVPLPFNSYSYVLGKRGLSAGKFYYEVQVGRKTGWDLGVVRQSVRGEKKITPKPSNGIWIIRLGNRRYSALCDVPFHLSVKKVPEDIGVFVDYDQGLVSFYDVSDATLIHSFTGCQFNERILPFFSPGLPEGGMNGAPLVLSPTTKGEKKSGKNPDFSSLIIFLVFVFIHFFVGLLLG